MNSLQFNALAIILLLVVLPFAVAFISNAGSTVGEEYQDSYDFTGTNPWPSTYTGINGYWWNNGGENFSSLYTSGTCGYVIDGYCTDTGGSWTATSISPPFFDSFEHPSSGVIFTQTHARISGYGTDPYIGNSGDGPFEWAIPQGAQNNLQNNVTFDKLRYGFIDHNNAYNCASHAWTNLSIEHSITFMHENKTKTFDGFITETSNKFEHYPYPNYHQECNVGFYIEYDFSSFESLEMVNWNGGDWLNTIFFVRIDDIDREDGVNTFNTELPFAGVDTFTFTSEYSSVDEVAANFFINAGTLVLTLATFALGVASTPYWDPFKNIFRGVQ